MENANVNVNNNTQQELEMQIKILQAQMEMLKGGNTINVVQQQQQQQQQQQGPSIGVHVTGNIKDGTIAFLLCLFAGFFGAHKFYEGKALTGLLYFFTGGLFFIGWIADCIALLGKIGKKYYV